MEIDFEFIVESAPDAVLIVSAEGRILRINAAAERMFGYPRQELVGQALELLLPPNIRDSHVACRTKFAANPSARPMGTDGDFLARRRDGSEFFVDVSLSPSKDGSVIAIARDVSDRKRINRELRDLTAALERRVSELGHQTAILESILSSMGDGVIVCDPSGKLLLANPAARHLHPSLSRADGRLELPRVAGEYGLFLADQLTPYPADELPMARVIRGEGVDGVEIFVRRPGVAEGIWTTVTGRPLLDGDGNIAGGVIVIRDTTALKFAQGALLAGQEAEGRRIARELHDSVSQDLCTLILDLVQLQQDLPEFLGTISARITEQKEKMMAVSDEIQSVCRQLHPSVLERIGLEQAMAQLCEEFTRSKGLDIRFSHEGTPASLPAASALCVYRVAQECLRNIVRHAQTRRATVRFYAADGGLHLTIDDDGVGFDPKTVDAKARLGLVGMQERVRLAGGTITIRSAPGNGTRIDLRVPLLDESQLPAPGATRPVSIAVS